MIHPMAKLKKQLGSVFFNLPWRKQYQKAFRSWFPIALVLLAGLLKTAALDALRTTSSGDPLAGLPSDVVVPCTEDVEDMVRAAAVKLVDARRVRFSKKRLMGPDFFQNNWVQFSGYFFGETWH